MSSIPILSGAYLNGACLTGRKKKCNESIWNRYSGKSVDGKRQGRGALGVRFSITPSPFRKPPSPHLRRLIRGNGAALRAATGSCFISFAWFTPDASGMCLLLLGEWALFQPGCQVPGCLLCASVCVIRDRDWIRDGSVATVRWKYHTRYLYLPTRLARSSPTGASPSPTSPPPERTNSSATG